MDTKNDWFDSIEWTPHRRIVCAANQFSFTEESGIPPLIVTGARHYDKLMHAQINAISDDIWKEKIGEVQGFVDQYGVFLTREEAHVVAMDAKQSIRRCGNDLVKLWSENLY